MDSPADAIDCAHAAEDAIQELCQVTMHPPSMTPAEVDVLLGHLAAAIAALP